MKGLELKARVSKTLAIQASKLMPVLPDPTIIRILTLLEKISPKVHKSKIKTTINLFKQKHPGLDLTKNILKNVNQKYRSNLLGNLVVNNFIINQDKRDKAKEKGETVPWTVLISPTMRCNLSCTGCYAANYKREDDLPMEVVDRIITEGKEMGVAFFTILGGEPFVMSELLDLYKKHNDTFFQIYTNGTLLTEDIIKRLAGLGNVLPTLSIEGFEAETDLRRGKGTYKKLMDAMVLLRKHKVPFGFSTVATRKNIEIVSSDEFIDMMIDKGAYIGWYFLYMPIGDKPDLSLMPTPDQRAYLLERDKYIRANKPLFIVDFWNDAPYVGGCIAAKEYIHINSKGDVEPCIFTHFSQDNIKDKSLKECLESDFFKAIRKRQPYDENLYLPCMLIDHPEVIRELHEEVDIHPTHEGAESLLNDLHDGIDEYSKKTKKKYKAIWERDKDTFSCLGCGGK